MATRKCDECKIIPVEFTAENHKLLTNFQAWLKLYKNCKLNLTQVVNNKILRDPNAFMEFINSQK